MNPMHLSKQAEWATPKWLVDFARFTLGGIDCDPATSVKFNSMYVKADWIYTKSDNGGRGGLAPGIDWPGLVFLNPPGDRSGELVKQFALEAVNHWMTGATKALFWVGFSLEQLVSFQKALGSNNPLTLGHLLIPRKRVCFLDEEGTSQKAPTHGNFLWLLPRIGDRNMVVRFRFSIEAQAIGASPR